MLANPGQLLYPLNTNLPAALTVGTDYVICITAGTTAVPTGVYIGTAAEVQTISIFSFDGFTNVRAVDGNGNISATQTTWQAANQSITFAVHEVQTTEPINQTELRNVSEGVGDGTTVFAVPNDGANINRANFVGLPTVDDINVATEDWVRDNSLVNGGGVAVRTDLPARTADAITIVNDNGGCLLYTSPSPRDS